MMEPIAEVAPAPYDWSGFYAGISASRADSTNNYYFNDSFDNGLWDLEGDVLGVLGGCNMQRSNLVYGVELNAHFREIRGVVVFVDKKYSRVVDLKGRVGYTVGSALVYGAVGYSWSRFGEDYAGEDVTLGGVGYGVGVDYAVTDRVFVGLEYFHRDQSGELDCAPGYSIEDTDLDTVTHRVGMTF